MKKSIISGLFGFFFLNSLLLYEFIFHKPITLGKLLIHAVFAIYSLIWLYKDTVRPIWECYINKDVIHKKGYIVRIHFDNPYPQFLPWRKYYLIKIDSAKTLLYYIPGRNDNKDMFYENSKIEYSYLPKSAIILDIHFLEQKL